MYKRINENEIEVYKSGIYENHQDYKSFYLLKLTISGNGTILN